MGRTRVAKKFKVLTHPALLAAVALIFFQNLVLHAAENALKDSPSSVSFQVNAQNRIQVLNGPWDFYWQQQLSASNLNGNRSSTYEPSESWTSIMDTATGKPFPAVGFASFVLRLDNFRPSPAGYEIEFREPMTAGELEIFPTNQPTEAIIFKIGNVSAQSNLMIPSKGILQVSLPSHWSSSSLTFVLRISNNFFEKAGQWYPLRIGYGQTLSQQHHRQLLAQYVCLGILFIMGLWNITLFLQRREDIASAALGIHCFIIALRIVVTSYLPYQWGGFEGVGWFEMMMFFGYASLTLGSLSFLYFIRYSFPIKMPEILHRVTLFTGALLFLFTCTTHSLTFTAYLTIFQIYVLACVVIGIWHVSRAYRQGLTGGLLSLVGCALFGMSIFYDVLLTKGIISGSFITPYGLAAFIFLNSQISALRFAQAFVNQKKLGLDLLKAHEDLQDQEKQRTAIFQNTSHELRTPLHGIQGFLELALSGKYGQLEDNLRGSIQTCSNLAQTLHLRVNAIMDLAHSRNGEMILHSEKINLAVFQQRLKAIADELLQRYPSTQFHSELVLNGKSQDYIQDSEKLLSIMRNVLDNAFKFRDLSRPNTVKLRLIRQGDALVIEVQDQGIGIKSDQQGRVFEEFTQVEDDARRTYEGAGLGLPLVKGLVSFLKGRLEMQSNLGTGTCIRLEIPEAQAGTVLMQTESALKNVEIQAPKVPPKILPEPIHSTVQQALSLIPAHYRILIVDDNQTNVELLEEVLDLQGYRYNGLLSGRDCLKSMQEERPDLLLLDMMMPEFSGEDVLKAMKKDPRLSDIPVIFITARASDEDKVFGLDLGADDYVAKPVQIDELCLRIRNLLLRVEASRRIGEQVHLDKMSQLGELLADVSHELKNLFQGVSLEAKESSAHYFSTLASLPLPVELKAILQKVSSVPGFTMESLLQVSEIKAPPSNHPQYRELRILRMHLCQWPLSNEARQNFWQLALSESAEWIDSILHHLALIQSHQLLLYITMRSQAITEAVLEVNRNFEKGEMCSAKETIQGVLPLLTPRTRRSQIQLELDIPSETVLISKGTLQQIALNLLANAIDATQELPLDQRKVSVHWNPGESTDVILFVNGGPKIPPEIARNLFRKGFSTKGEKGTGIGLNLSQRLAREAGGQLEIDLTHEHTCFTLSLPKAKLNSAA